MLPSRRWALAVAAVPLRERGLSCDELPRDGVACRHSLAAAHSIRSRSDALDFLDHGHTADAYDLGRLAYAAAASVAPGFLDEDTAWAALLRIARLARPMYRSWRDFGEAYALGLHQISDGRASCADTVQALLDDPASPWSTLPWELDLG
jgi:hypothetical protein